MKKINRRRFIKNVLASGAALYLPDFFLDSPGKAYAGLPSPEPDFSRGSESQEVKQEVDSEIQILLDTNPRLYLFTENLNKSYPVAAGKKYARTPKGNFRILRKVHEPSWCPDPERQWVRDIGWFMDYLKDTGEKCVPFDHPKHPLGEWKLTFKPRYHIHGNGDGAINNGKRYVSRGCVRMRDKDIKELVFYVDEGTPVNII